MTKRQAAGWVVLSLIPIIALILAVLAGQLAEMAVGFAIGGALLLAAWVGVGLIHGDPRRTRP